MDTYEAIRTRRSVRKYRDRAVPEETLVRILDAARLAPSAKNFQEWRFVVVRDPKMREQLAAAALGQPFVAEAPVCIVCCAETDGYVMTCGQACYPIDVAIAIDHMTLAAVVEGLGTCWVGAFHEDEVKRLLGIPQPVRVVNLLPLGYPASPAAVTKRRHPLETLVHWGTW